MCKRGRGAGRGKSPRRLRFEHPLHSHPGAHQSAGQVAGRGEQGLPGGANKKKRESGAEGARRHVRGEFRTIPTDAASFLWEVASSRSANQSRGVRGKKCPCRDPPFRSGWNATRPGDVEPPHTCPRDTGCSPLWRGRGAQRSQRRASGCVPKGSGLVFVPKRAQQRPLRAGLA